MFSGTSQGKPLQGKGGIRLCLVYFFIFFSEAILTRQNEKKMSGAFNPCSFTPAASLRSLDHREKRGHGNKEASEMGSLVLFGFLPAQIMLFFFFKKKIVEEIFSVRREERCSGMCGALFWLQRAALLAFSHVKSPQK